MTVRQCDSAHCSGADAEINEICKQLGWPVNHPVLTRDSQGPCICSCSCLAHGTMVQIAPDAFTEIETIRVGDQVLAAGLELAWTEQPVVFSQGTTGASRQKYTVLIAYLDTGLAVTSDHLFLLADKTLKTADRLVPGDLLMAPDGSPVPLHSVHIGDYTAGFHHVATSKEKPNATLDGHLLNTNGVVSGDYTLQLYYRTGTLSDRLAPRHQDLPVVGSPEYLAIHGPASRQAPQSNAVRVAGYNAADHRPGTFVPAELTIVKIPDDACRFISDDDAKRKQLEPRRAWNDPQSREWTEAVIEHFRNFYPGVVYHFDWADETVNAYAWIQSGVRHVAIKGGLVRHWSIALESTGLVLAHELAHHYGGSPTFPGGLSCEGQADYYGTSIVMRKVWFGTTYIDQMTAAISQMAGFFGVPDQPGNPGGSAGCNHPAGACRIATYYAAMDLGAKPSCAK